MNVEDGKKEKKIFKWNNGEKIGELWEEIELNKGRDKLHQNGWDELDRNLIQLKAIPKAKLEFL